MQKDSVEEQRFRSLLRIEQEAFHSLILEKSRMVITEEWDDAPPVRISRDCNTAAHCHALLTPSTTHTLPSYLLAA